MGLWFLKIDGTEIMVPVFAGVFCRLLLSALFLLTFLFFLKKEESWRRNA